MLAHSKENAMDMRSSHNDRHPPECQALLQCAAPYPHSDHLANLLQRVHWPLFLALAEEHGLVPLLPEQMPNLESSLVSQDVRLGLRDTRAAQPAFTLQSPP